VEQLSRGDWAVVNGCKSTPKEVIHQIDLVINRDDEVSGVIRLAGRQADRLAGCHWTTIGRLPLLSLPRCQATERKRDSISYALTF